MLIRVFFILPIDKLLIYIANKITKTFLHLQLAPVIASEAKQSRYPTTP